ncbi:hypothetical protein [Anaerofustis sp.]|uniref:hypothetical protein n=1 Tax=Anaerofustis sp. TaxID=1872517 RepID=UPI0025BB1A5A|nr:hypothetical protein [Anaerofustis sp.]
MNYADFKVIKDKLERRAKILSFVPIFIFLAMIFQIVLLIARTQTDATWFNFVLVDQLFTNARLFYNVQNVVLSVMFYGAVGVSVIIMGTCAFFCYKNVKFAYSVIIFFYIIDFIITILSIDYIQMGIHFVFLCLMFYANRTLTHLNSIPKEVWGYGE